MSNRKLCINALAVKVCRSRHIRRNIFDHLSGHIRRSTTGEHSRVVARLSVLHQNFRFGVLVGIDYTSSRPKLEPFVSMFPAPATCSAEEGTTPGSSRYAKTWKRPKSPPQAKVEGYRVEPAGGDFIVRVAHRQTGDVQIEGR